MYPRLVENALYFLGWHWTPDNPVCTSQVLGLEVYSTIFSLHKLLCVCPHICTHLYAHVFANCFPLMLSLLRHKFRAVQVRLQKSSWSQNVSGHKFVSLYPSVRITRLLFKTLSYNLQTIWWEDPGIFSKSFFKWFFHLHEIFENHKYLNLKTYKMMRNYINEARQSGRL